MEDVSHSRRCMQTSSIKRVAKEENSIPSLIMEIDNLNQNLPPGFRFHPTDEELVAYYLHTKLSDHGFSPYAIADVDFNKSEPWDLPDKAKIGEKEWYFFSLRDRKYPTGHRTNRATNSGYWKTTGKDKEIFHGETQVGMKKTLVFYKGRAPRGEKTNWIMHEYRHQTKNVYRPPEEEWVVFRIFRKPDSCKKLLLLKSSALASASSQSYQAPTIDSPCRINDTTKAGDFITAVHDGEIPVLYNQQPADVTPPTSFNQFASTSCNNIISSSRMDMRKNWTSVAEDAVADDQHQQQYYDSNWPGSLLHESNLLSNSDLFSGEMRFGFYPQGDAFVDNTGRFCK